MFLLLLPLEVTLAAAGEGPASSLALVTVTADELPPPVVPVSPPDEDVFIPLLSLLPPFTGDDAEKKNKSHLAAAALHFGAIHFG